MLGLSKQFPIAVGNGIEVTNYSFDACFYTADLYAYKNFQSKLSYALLSCVFKIVKIEKAYILLISSIDPAFRSIFVCGP